MSCKLLSIPNYRVLAAALVVSAVAGCVPKPPGGMPREVSRELPESFEGLSDTQSSGLVAWREFFDDPYLCALVEGALENNQELNITVQEALITNAEVLARRGEYLPRMGFGVGAGAEHVGELTSQGRSDEMADIGPTLQEYRFGLYASWEIDVWGRLHDLADAAVYRYLSSIEGRNFMVTRLVAEIASSYYELMGLDRQLQVVTDNIALQQSALEIVRLQFEAGRVTSLATTRFEAELRDMESSRFEILQRIVETENRLNSLAGRFPQPVERASADFLGLRLPAMSIGVPSQLLENRPDVRQAELELAAAKLDVSAAKAAFYPSLGIEATIGYESYDLTKWVDTPDSLLFGAFAKVFAPLLNRKGLEANYYSTNSRQMQAVLQYERAVLTALVEVNNRVRLIRNLSQGYELKAQQVDRLVESIEISTMLFNSARADYLEVLTTRRESLEAQIELIEMKQRQMVATVTLYQALGGGWRGTGLLPPDGSGAAAEGPTENNPNQSTPETTQ